MTGMSLTSCVRLQSGMGHSFGGLVLKSLVVEARRHASLPERAQKNEQTRSVCAACKAFLEKVNCAVFYGTPHSGSDAATVVKNLQKIAKIPTLAKFIKNLEPFETNMELLSVEFEDAARQDISIFAFAEGRPISLLCGLQSVLSLHEIPDVQQASISLRHFLQYLFFF
jgi:hypothetical protein